MKLSRLLLTLALACSVPWASAAEETYPDKPIRLIANYGPGSSIDIIARLVAQPLSEQLGQPVIVENRSGAGGDLGVDFVAKAPSDGYTIGFAAPGPLVFNPMMRESMPFAPDEIAPVILLATGPNVLLANPDVPATTLSELVEHIRENPESVAFASPGTGTSGHLAGELFKHLTETDILHVPYRGNAEAITDVLAGHVQLLFSGVPPILGHVETGDLRAIAIADARRARLLPDVPTVEEAGLPGAESGAWYGILAPAGVPESILDRLNAEFETVLQRPEVREQLDNLGIDIADSNSRADFEQMIADEIARWTPLFESTTITAD